MSDENNNSAYPLVVFPGDNEKCIEFLNRINKTKFKSGQPIVLNINKFEKELNDNLNLITDFSEKIKTFSDGAAIITTNKKIKKILNEKGIKVISNISRFKKISLKQKLPLDSFSETTPGLWKQKLRSSLQSLGVLSLPKTRIWSVIILSMITFSFVAFKLLPSAEIKIWPAQNTTTHTTNIYLVKSGTETTENQDIPESSKKMDLIPFSVTSTLSMTFDQISTVFTGQSARVPITVLNQSDEKYSLRRGTRFINQAGMVFRLETGLIIEAKSEATALAVSDDTDVYGTVIGDRGNVPAGLKWEIPGLTPEERKIIYGENRQPGTGGASSHKYVLQKSDLELAKKILQQELLVQAKKFAEEKKYSFLKENPNAVLEFLDRTTYENQLTQIDYFDFQLNDKFIKHEVSSIPVKGSIKYTVFGFDKNKILNTLKSELITHISDKKILLTDSLNIQNIHYVVISYDDELNWIKLTVDLTATEQFDIDPFSAAGSSFTLKVRQSVTGLNKENAIRILKNFPEVDDVEIKLWPPWNNSLPTISSHIVIKQIKT